MSRDQSEKTNVGEDHLPNLILPIGTHVVTRSRIEDSHGRTIRPEGSVGVIVGVPEDHSHAYRVRFPGNEELRLKRRQLRIRRLGQKEDLEAMLSEQDDRDLTKFVIYRCIVGSRAYGLHDDDSDVDRRGFYLPPADLHWSIYGVPEQLENQDSQECYWEIRKFVALALKGNPNILECLYTPLVETAAPLAQELLGIREIFLSRLIYQTYVGYALSQFKKIEQDLRNQGAIKWKHAMHLIRLVISGITALREKRISVNVDEHREKLLMIKRGEIPWDEVNGWFLRLHKEFDAAFETTELPSRPDYRAANDFLVRARRSMV